MERKRGKFKRAPKQVKRQKSEKKTEQKMKIKRGKRHEMSGDRARENRGKLTQLGHPDRTCGTQ